MSDHIDRLREFATRRNSQRNCENLKNMTFINTDIERINIDS